MKYQAKAGTKQPKVDPTVPNNEFEKAKQKAIQMATFKNILK